MKHAVTRTSYDRISRWYDWFSGSERRYIDRCLSMLSPRPGERALEMGCGTGYGAEKLAQILGSGKLVTGMDLSMGMLRVARRKQNKAFLTGGDALRTPFPDAVFDLILMSFTLELFPDEEIPLVLNECERLLRPGGRLGVVGLAEKGEAGAMVRLYQWAHRKFPRLVDCRPLNFRRWIEDAGFLIHDQMEWKMWGLDVDGIVASKREGEEGNNT